jgi:hypothetical protein
MSWIIVQVQGADQRSLLLAEEESSEEGHDVA